MGIRDNVLFHASVASGVTAGTVIPLDFMYGIENVRQGYGKPKLKFVQAIYDGIYSAGNQQAIPVEVKNSSWIDSAGMLAQGVDEVTVFDRDNLSFMKGRDKELTPNTSWIINATLMANSTAAGDIYVLFEIEYEAGESKPTEKMAGSPVMKICTSASITANANEVINLGSFDNLIQNIRYYLSEASMISAGSVSGCNFLIIEGFANQKGLCRIFPIRGTGVTEPIEGSVELLKQTYNLKMIRSVATTSAVIPVYLEMIASTN